MLTYDSISLPDRFWSKVDIRREDECWNWKASVMPLGYGQFGCERSVIGLTRPGYTMSRAHKVAWILTNGPIENGLCVLHRCDNPPCCNPAHLFLGTQQDNVTDMCQKGRHGHGTIGGPRLHEPIVIAGGRGRIRQGSGKPPDGSA